MKNELQIYIAEVLNAYVGGNGLPIRDAAIALGGDNGPVSDSLVYAHRSHDGACPTVEQLFIYMRILPASFANAILRPTELTGAYHPLSLSTTKFKSVLQGVIQAGGIIKRLSDAAGDGIIDAGECRSLPPHIISAASYFSTLAFRLGEMRE